MIAKVPRSNVHHLRLERRPPPLRFWLRDVPTHGAQNMFQDSDLDACLAKFKGSESRREDFTSVSKTVLSRDEPRIGRLPSS